MHGSNSEQHRAGRTGWLRAAVLGANDGILSTSSLMLGVAAAHAARHSVMVAGVAGLVAIYGVRALAGNCESNASDGCSWRMLWI